jgi:hypothetical protein
MREPNPGRRRLFGLVGQFDEPQALLQAIGRIREQGFTRVEAHTPFPIEGLAEAEGFSESWNALATLAGGIIGAVYGYALQAYAHIDFPIDVGGRPLVPWQAFALVVFELLVLFAVSACVVSMVLLNGLPRLNHPLFEIPEFHLGAADRFFLVVESNDPKFDLEATRKALQGLGARAIFEAPFAETAK